MGDIDVLIDAVLDGTANDSERAQLARRLAEDPALRQAWWTEVGLRSHLREELSSARSEASGRRHRQRRAPRRRTIAPRRWLQPLATAAVLGVVIAGWILFVGRPEADSPASLAGNVSGAQSLRLADGSLLTFMNADATIEVADGSRILLRSGAVAADVATRPIDHPLVIVTTHGEAVVVGTRFTLSTDAEATLLQVDEGVVRLAGRSVGPGGVQLADATGLAVRTIFIDAINGPTLSQSCASLQAGDVVVLGAGVHERGGDADALATIVVAATRERPARIRAAPGTSPTLRSQGWDVLRISGDHLIMTGLRFIGTATGQGNGVVLSNGSNLRIAACHFTDFGGDGLNAHGIDGLLVEACTFTGNGARSRFGQGGLSIFHSAGTGGTVLRDLRLIGNRTGPTNQAAGEATGGQGLWIGHDEGIEPGGMVLVEACVISGNQGAGIACNDAGSVTVRDCRIIGNGTGPVGSLRAQISATGRSRIDLTGTVLACAPDTAVLSLWPPAGLGQVEGNQVWGGKPPGPGFTRLSTGPAPEP